MSTQEILQKELESMPEMCRKLFVRGYVVYSERPTGKDGFPFYGSWSDTEIDGYWFRIHPDQHFYYAKHGDVSVCMVGNALNSFDGKYHETQILPELASRYAQNRDTFFEYLNELTGCFALFVIENKRLHWFADASGMLFCAYGMVDGNLYISSHPQCLGDILNLHVSEYADRLRSYPHFRKYGVFYPGDLTWYDEIRRSLPNFEYTYDKSTIAKQRFFPISPQKPCQTEEDYKAVVQQCSNILKSIMKCASLKWEDASVSLSGGVDSRVTLAAANGCYHSFDYYSYHTMPGDLPDATAASEIARQLGLCHEIYTVPNNNEDFPDYAVHAMIQRHNMGDHHINDNDIRKRIWFDQNAPVKVEIKSWISEIGRANYYKKFGLRHMPKKLSPRHMTSMYKLFTTQRRLAKDTDRIFASYIKETCPKGFPTGYDASDMYLWEFRYGAWGGLVNTCEQSYAYEIFMPFNNRKLLQLMLSAPLQKRISDQLHEDIWLEANPSVGSLAKPVVNWNETKKRMYMEKAYFLVHSFFRFL